MVTTISLYCRNLQIVNLTNNSLSCPSIEWFNTNSNNLIIKLLGNPWICNNKIRRYWVNNILFFSNVIILGLYLKLHLGIKRFVIGKEGRTLGEYDIVCKYPSAARNRKLSTLAPSYFRAKPTKLEIVTTNLTTIAQMAKTSTILALTTTEKIEETTTYTGTTTTTYTTSSMPNISSGIRNPIKSNIQSDNEMYMYIIIAAIVVACITLMSLSVTYIYFKIKLRNIRWYKENYSSRFTAEADNCNGRPEHRDDVILSEPAYFNQQSIQHPVSVPIRILSSPPVRHSWSSSLNTPFLLRDPRHSSYACPYDHIQPEQRTSDFSRHLFREAAPIDFIRNAPNGHIYERVHCSQRHGSLV